MSQVKNIDGLSIEDALKEAQIDPSKIVSAPPIVLKIGESVVFTVGEISLVIGKAKSRKTFLIALFVASMTKYNEDQYIKSVLCSEKFRILLFDTEQGDYYASKTINRIIQMIDENRRPDIIGYRLRKYAPKDRLTMIEYAIRTTPNLLAVVIDGVRDLTFDINSPSEATDISSCLLRWSEEKQIHICSILHQNKSDENARGHLGTELVNKSESVISVRKIPGNNTSLVHAEYNRGLDFPDFEIAINPDGTPFISNFNVIQKANSAKRTPGEIDYEKIASDIFINQVQMTKNEITNELEQVLKNQKFPHSDQARRSVMNALKQRNLIIESTVGKSKYYELPGK